MLEDVAKYFDWKKEVFAQIVKLYGPINPFSKTDGSPWTFLNKASQKQDVSTHILQSSNGRLAMQLSLFLFQAQGMEFIPQHSVLASVD